MRSCAPTPRDVHRLFVLTTTDGYVFYLCLFVRLSVRLLDYSKLNRRRSGESLSKLVRRLTELKASRFVSRIQIRLKSYKLRCSAVSRVTGTPTCLFDTNIQGGLK